ncbi:MAG: maleylacetoacetate isomerase [Emcibacter sp.]|nr:maleylacetoacetate isomerase [Emcibacter sp.]
MTKNNSINALYTFWRSSASYRVRIALNLKGIDHDSVEIDFRKDGGQHRKPEFLSKNPQGLLPVWQEGDWYLSQSLAILEYLEETQRDIPLLPDEARERARVRELCQIIACEIHPLNNLRVMSYLKANMGQEDEAVNEWYRHWVALSFAPLEQRLNDVAGTYCHGDHLSLADCCLVPQVYNARRFNCDMSPYPTIVKIDKTLNELTAFQDAAPEKQL